MGPPRSNSIATRRTASCFCAPRTITARLAPLRCKASSGSKPGSSSRARASVSASSSSLKVGEPVLKRSGSRQEAKRESSSSSSSSSDSRSSEARAQLESCRGELSSARMRISKLEQQNAATCPAPSASADNGPLGSNGNNKGDLEGAVLQLLNSRQGGSDSGDAIARIKALLDERDKLKVSESVSCFSVCVCILNGYFSSFFLDRCRVPD